MGKNPAAPKKASAYDVIIEKIFFDHYVDGSSDFRFAREEIPAAALAMNVKVPDNLGDTIYTFRYRKQLPQRILDTQPAGKYWLILGAGDALYRFRLSTLATISPTPGLLVRKIPDATPEIITRYAFSDEQALLAKIRYNRLIDIFLGITGYSLQSHLRTKIPNYGQIEIDELYVGIDARGAQYVIPVQAKGGTDKLGVIQTIQDTAFCQHQPRYSQSIARPVSAQFMAADIIALFELSFDGDDVSIVQERHYRLTETANINDNDLETYRRG
ncbi:MAG TPA: endonuclease [Methylomirabilota bacterium]|nr:endonuclease [Methylomirabilota bacterium]